MENKKLSDLTDLTNDEIKQAYKKYEPSIKILRFWEINFYIWLSIISILLSIYFQDNDNLKLFFSIIWIISVFYIWHRSWYKEWFYDWFEWWYSDWAKNAIMYERNMTDEDISNIQEIETLS